MSTEAYGVLALMLLSGLCYLLFSGILAHLQTRKVRRIREDSERERDRLVAESEKYLALIKDLEVSR